MFYVTILGIVISLPMLMHRYTVHHKTNSKSEVYSIRICKTFQVKQAKYKDRERGGGDQRRTSTEVEIDQDGSPGNKGNSICWIGYIFVTWIWNLANCRCQDFFASYGFGGIDWYYSLIHYYRRRHCMEAPSADVVKYLRFQSSHHPMNSHKFVLQKFAAVTDNNWVNVQKCLYKGVLEAGS